MCSVIYMYILSDGDHAGRCLCAVLYTCIYLVMVIMQGDAYVQCYVYSVIMYYSYILSDFL